MGFLQFKKSPYWTIFVVQQLKSAEMNIQRMRLLPWIIDVWAKLLIAAIITGFYIFSV